jgi:1,4-dihydroxy-2-naphthoate octaprenyltransferase
MNEKQPAMIGLLVRYSRPWSLLAGVLTYCLGGGIVKYLGHALNWDRFWSGLLAVIVLMLASNALKLYYDLIDAASPLRRMRKDVEDELAQAAQRLSRPSVLMACYSLLTAGTVVTVLMMAQGALSYAAFMLLGAAFLLAFFYGVPPLRLASRGYGEFSEAVMVCGLFPALAYILQTGDLHRLLPMLAFPLLVLYLAMRLAQSLESYAHDQKMGWKTMMLVVGWQRGMLIHNVLILSGYLLLAMAAVLSLPWQLTWPGLLSLPVGLFQIYQINQISTGARPGWRLLKLTSAATFALMAYLMALALWTG